MYQLLARRYDDRQPVVLRIEGETIAAVDPADVDRSSSQPGDSAADNLPMVAPAFFDHQINGYGGVWFSDEQLDVEDVLRTAEAHFQFGITRLFPTLITNSYPALERGFRALREACESNMWVDRMLPGFHLEGPYLSGEDGPRGAHPRNQIRAADWDEFQRWQEAAGGRIKLLTIAPEVENGIPFIEKAVASGVTVSIGHTAAEPEQIQAAADSGARFSTHLGNGAHGQLRRHPNYIWEQLGDSRLAAGVISDGHHLPPSVLRSVLGVKGPDKTFITCDASGLAGCKPGPYQFESVDVEVLADGPIVIAGQRQLLAGSGQQTDVCVGHMYAVTEASLADCFDMAGKYPARWFGIDPISLDAGSRADLVLFHEPQRGERLRIVQTIAAGETRFDFGRGGRDQ
jgi:N-acetylglucosamine-6-phosphate deacetylase